MEKVLGNEVIQSIRVGVVGGTFSMQWSLGGEMNIGGNRWVISDIVRDDAGYYYYGIISYLIYGEFGGEKKLLKVYENQAVSLSIKI